MAQQHGIIAFEMEGAGVWDEIPCIIVKSVCDYADSHKNKNWQGFAAVAAASATKAVLNMYFATAPTASTATTYVSHTIEAPPPAFIVPYNENPDFVGRSEILERVKDLFGHSDTYHRPGSKPRSRVALHGLGGVGKTQIALAYCYWFKERYPDASVFWIHASNVERFQKAFSDIARECEIPGHEDKEVDILSLVKRWLEDKRRGQWLLVIDNADDTEVFFPTNLTAQAGRRTTSLGHSIPECSHGSVLITTRNKQAGLKLTRGKPPIEVQRMTEAETTQLLRTLLEDENVAPAEASLLSSRLEHLPLALAQAASFILENSTSIKAYVGLLDKSDSSMVDRLSEPFEAVGRDTETPHALTATWAISFEHIERQKPMASNVLYLMSSFDRQGIPKQFVWDYCHETLRLAGDSENDFQIDTDLEVTQALGILQAFSYISKAGDDLLSEWCTTRFQWENTRTKWYFSNYSRMHSLFWNAQKPLESIHLKRTPGFHLKLPNAFEFEGNTKHRSYFISVLWTCTSNFMDQRTKTRQMLYAV
ncbi:hypothetical protein CGCA056_v004492 [Colletotrichum aenigma]|uniref:uncharacterized protein n=1 Tax=Colletotrichum aenigma TaxID=1215731 RepID=UPI001872257E|nr:uncharacterized protein CGCA056_v004492 [Colletotrichum aenigma]KAF5524355.1 hypothetical protein CGCA056_v004492 [Colletotrichum aenigma]